MPEPPTRRDELIRLVDASSSPVPPASRSRLAQALRAILVRAGRPHALHQQRVDRALIAWAEERADRQDAEVARLRGELSAMHSWLQATSDRGDELGGTVGWLREEGLLDTAFRAELRRLVAADSALGARELGLETFDDELGHAVVGFRGTGRRDGVYLGFEDVFRGPETVIAERQRAYLPLLRDRAPVLDVGCGRGELLDLLRDADVEARGVDLDEGMVQRCIDKGLAVRRGDANSALAELAPASLGAIVAAQVIEHLPYEQLIAFLRGAATALRPGGIVLLETVNPHAPQALKQFWIDPTHQHPLFPEVILALLRIVGFAEGYVWHPQGTGDPERDRGEQLDYTVVATLSAA